MVGLHAYPGHSRLSNTLLGYGAEDQKAGLYGLYGQLKMVEKAVDMMQFFQLSRQISRGRIQ